MSDQDWTPVTAENCQQVPGPFYHGTRHALQQGDLLVPGHASNYEGGRVARHVYFTAVLETAVWGAELAASLAGCEGTGRIYVVETTGPFEDDPNVTNKRFPGNPTRSYRTRVPLRVVGEVAAWPAHSPEVLQQMLDHLARLKRSGLGVIED